jgi:hypothetical protein
MVIGKMADVPTASVFFIKLRLQVLQRYGHLATLKADLGLLELLWNVIAAARTVDDINTQHSPLEVLR